MAVFILAVTLALLAAPVPSIGQQPGKVYRMGFLWNAPPAPADMNPHGCPIQGRPNWQAIMGWQAIMEGLREYGYLPGQNLLIECRWTEGRAERAPALAAELVSLKPDLIVVIGLTAGVRAAMQATSTIPIVLVDVNDPVEQGLVASLAHPGGNVTGLSGSATSLISGKRLELLKEVVPKVSRVAVLRYSGGGAGVPGRDREREATARALGLRLHYYGVRAPEELQGAFAAMAKARADALLVEDWAFLAVHHQRIVALAAQSRLPAVYA